MALAFSDRAAQTLRPKYGFRFVHKRTRLRDIGRCARYDT